MAIQSAQCLVVCVCVCVCATASHIKAEVDSLADRFVNTDPVLLEVDRRPDELDKLIQSHDIVIRSAASCCSPLRAV